MKNFKEQACSELDVSENVGTTTETQKDYGNTFRKKIQSVDEVADFLGMSTSWVYDHWEKIEGVKLGGSLFFPNEEDLYERLFNKRKGVEVRLHPERQKTHGNVVQNKKGGKPSRSKSKRGVEQAGSENGNSNRHGLLGSAE